MTHIKKYRWEDFTGVLPFRMTSDYLFKYLLQSDSAVLKAIICAYLDIKPEDIRSIRVTNTISLSDDPAKKEMILDIKVEMNDDTIINLEMQVINNHDYPERSVLYLCRCFDNLHAGQGYRFVKGAYHLGFLDYTLFPENPEFFASYRLRNERTGQLYTSKFGISVVDLTQRDLATDEDRLHHRDLWASFFKAKTWEELIMLAQQDSNIKEAVNAVHMLTQDEKFRLQYEAREDFIRQQIDHDDWFNTEIRKRDAIITRTQTALAERDATITRTRTALTDAQTALTDTQTALAERDATITRTRTALTDAQTALAERDARIAELERKLAGK